MSCCADIWPFADGDVSDILWAYDFDILFVLCVWGRVEEKRPGIGLAEMYTYLNPPQVIRTLYPGFPDVAG